MSEISWMKIDIDVTTHSFTFRNVLSNMNKGIEVFIHILNILGNETKNISHVG